MPFVQDELARTSMNIQHQRCKHVADLCTLHTQTQLTTPYEHFNLQPGPGLPTHARARKCNAYAEFVDVSPMHHEIHNNEKPTPIWKQLQICPLLPGRRAPAQLVSTKSCATVSNCWLPPLLQCSPGSLWTLAAVMPSSVLEAGPGHWLQRCRSAP